MFDRFSSKRIAASIAAACVVATTSAVGQSSIARPTSTPSIATSVIPYGPVSIIGNGWLVDGRDEPLPVTVSIFDQGSTVPFVTHETQATASRCNNRGQCFGGGTFTNKFTLAEIGRDRHNRCADLRAEATSVGNPTVKVSFWLPSCLR